VQTEGDGITVDAGGQERAMNIDAYNKLSVDDKNKYIVIPEYKQHVPFAQLDSCHVSRAKIFHRRFLDITMYGDNVKLHVVKSSWENKERI